MANLKMTISLPEELAIQFVRSVPAKRRSKFVAGLIEAKLAERRAELEARREAMLIAACDALNADPEIAELERDMDGLSGDGLNEHEWEESASR